jgi:hypothetical protein
MESENGAKAMDERKASRGKIRSETVTVRLDQKLRYLAELGARKQRRTLSSFIEWAIENSLRSVTIEEGFNRSVSIGDVDSQLWDVEEADRFAKLALRYPELLTHHEQVVWKLLRENGFFWLGHYNQNNDWIWRVEFESLIWDRLRAWWLALNAVASGGDKADLPTWSKKRLPEPKPESTARSAEDEDIPF